MGKAKDALNLWDALVPKVTQLVDSKTRSAVRKKKMNIASVDTQTQTAAVYEAATPDTIIMLPYRLGTGVEYMTAGQSVLVEWVYGDFSTAVIVSPGSGYSSAAAPTEAIARFG